MARAAQKQRSSIGGGMLEVWSAASGTARSRSAINSSSGSRHIAIGTSSERGQLDTRPQGAAFFQPGDDAAGGLGRLLADRLDHGFVKFLHDPQIDQGSGDRELQAELLADFAGELQDDVGEGRAIAAVRRASCTAQPSSSSITCWTRSRRAVADSFSSTTSLARSSATTREVRWRIRFRR